MAHIVVAARRPLDPDHPAEPVPGVLARLLPPTRRVRAALISAACSVLLIGLMTGAAILCADGACPSLPNPGPAQAVLELDDGGADTPSPPAPLTPVSAHR